MTSYLLSVHTSDARRSPRSSDDTQEASNRIAELDAEMKDAGAWVAAGRLDAPSSSAVVERHKGQIRVTDGPFIEAKEQIAGFYIIEAADLESAIGWASKTSDAISMPIEVRPFVAVTIG